MEKNLSEIKDLEDYYWNKEKVESLWESEEGSCKITIEEGKNSEIDPEKMVEQFKGLMYALGYQGETVEGYFAH